MKQLIIVTFSIFCLNAETIHIPADYGTIQEGLNAASEADTVLVADGIYYENIIWPATNGINLIGSGQDSTIIDGDSQSNVIMFEENLGGIIDISTFISGFTIQNSNSNVTSIGGSGLYCFNASPTLENLIFKNNSASYGGGMFLWNCSPTLMNVSILENSASGDGGGIYCGENSSPTLLNVSIRDNSASYHGGGMFLWNCNPLLVDVFITNNSANFDGGGIYCRNNASPILREAIITDNSASGDGGGIYCRDNSNPILENVIILGNSAGYGGGVGLSDSSPYFENVLLAENSASYSGGGISCSNSNPNLVNVTIINNSAILGGVIRCNDSNPRLVNCIVWSNYPQEIYLGSDFELSSVTVAFSTVQGGNGTIVTESNSEVNWLDGNIETDPLFVDPNNGDFTLHEDSPCIDSGTDFFVWEGDTILNLSEDEYVGEAPDMGAFEFDAGLLGDVNQDGEINVVDIIMTVNFILSAEYVSIADLNSDGAVNVVDVIMIVNIILEGV